MKKKTVKADTRTNAEKATERVQAILQEMGCVIRSQVVIEGSVVTTKIYIEEAKA